jgi:hypothetical protein
MCGVHNWVFDTHLVDKNKNLQFFKERDENLSLFFVDLLSKPIFIIKI